MIVDITTFSTNQVGIKRDVDIHRKYTKYEITCLCVQMKWTVPIEFYSDEPDSDDAGMG